VLELVLVAPPGEIPPEEELELVRATIWKEEHRYRARTVLQGNPEKDLAFLERLFKRVRGKDEVHVVQKDGGGVARRYVAQHGRASVSVLVAMGVHADRSVYALRWTRTKTNSLGDPPDLTRTIRETFKHPEVKAELEALEEKVFRRYPALGALRWAEKRPYLVEAEERGQVVFLLDPFYEVQYLLIGRAVLPLSIPYEGWKLKEVREQTLTKVIRERTRLESLRPKAIRALLRGEGSVDEVEVAVAASHLSRLGEP
jgi:hypothetical protein